MSKFVLSAALIGVLASDLLQALEPVAQKHFGSTGADVVEALAQIAPAAAASAGKGQPANQPALTVTTNGQTTATDAAFEMAADVGAMAAEEALQPQSHPEA